MRAGFEWTARQRLHRREFCVIVATACRLINERRITHFAAALRMTTPARPRRVRDSGPVPPTGPPPLILPPPLRRACQSRKHVRVWLAVLAGIALLTTALVYYLWPAQYYVVDFPCPASDSVEVLYDHNFNVMYHDEKAMADVAKGRVVYLAPGTRLREIERVSGRPQKTDITHYWIRVEDGPMKGRKFLVSRLFVRRLEE